ncbi:MAG: hypothetical protein MUC74_04445, partial [Ideonella sp.]|nr:hypothetical protein [Ideonella sp.]
MTAVAGSGAGTATDGLVPTVRTFGAVDRTGPVPVEATPVGPAWATIPEGDEGAWVNQTMAPTAPTPATIAADPVQRR